MKLEISEILNDEQYRIALKRIEECIFDLSENNLDEINRLLDVIERYENVNFPINEPKMNTKVLFRLEQIGKDVKDLMSIFPDTQAYNNFVQNNVISNYGIFKRIKKDFL